MQKVDTQQYSKCIKCNFLQKVKAFLGVLGSILSTSSTADPHVVRRYLVELNNPKLSSFIKCPCIQYKCFLHQHIHIPDLDYFCKATDGQSSKKLFFFVLLHVFDFFRVYSIMINFMWRAFIYISALIKDQNFLTDRSAVSLSKTELKS